MRNARRTVASLVASLLGTVLATVGPAPAPALAAATDGRTRLDPAFAGGLVTGSLDPERDLVLDVAVQPDGRVVAAGLMGGALVVLRLSAGGAVDPTFGSGGAFVLDTDDDDAIREVALGPGGTIVLGGWSDGGPVVIRLTPSGQLDPAFSGGIVRPLPAGRVEAMAVQPDGRVVIGLAGGAGSALARLLPDGTLDAAFGDGGTVSSSLFNTGDGVSALVAYPDGAVVAGGTGWGPLFSTNTTAFTQLRRSTPAGEVDATFGNGGSLVTEFDTAHVDRGAVLGALALLPDGRILATGIASQDAVPVPPPGPGTPPPPAGLRVSAEGHVALVRYHPDGRLDTSLAGVGKLVTPVPVRPKPELPPGTVLTADDTTTGDDVAIDASGRILVAGTAHGPDGHPALFRFTAAGLLDTTFGDGGMFVLDRSRTGSAYAVAVQADGHVLVAGGLTRATEFEEDVMVARVAPGASAGRVRAWGWNAAGQLGDATTADRSAPVLVPGLTGVVDVSAGGYHTLALRGDGTVWAWGWNGVGQLGDGSSSDRYVPVPVPGLDGVVAVAAGTFHSLALRGDGTVWAWGWNPVGQLGDGTTETRLRPVQVEGLGDVVGISAGSYHSVAVRDDVTAWAWGWNGTGQLGDGTTADRLEPVRVAKVEMIHGLVAVSAGGLHTQAQSAAVDSLAWGWNGYGQMGTPTGGALTLPGSRVIGTLSVAAGTYHGLRLTWRGQVLAAGLNSAGQLGDGGTSNHGWGQPVPALARVAGIAAGGFHSVALTEDRRVHAWGWNGVGQLGTGGTADRHVPAAVPGLADVVAVSAGLAHTAAITA